MGSDPGKALPQAPSVPASRGAPVSSTWRSNWPRAPGSEERHCPANWGREREGREMLPDHKQKMQWTVLSCQHVIKDAPRHQHKWAAWSENEPPMPAKPGIPTPAAPSALGRTGAPALRRGVREGGMWEKLPTSIVPRCLCKGRHQGGRQADQGRDRERGEKRGRGRKERERERER